MLKIYAYTGCSTCRNALKWLRQNGIAFEEVPIREKPPTLAELKAMLAANDGVLRALFNTSGLDYRALDLKNKLPKMTKEAALQLLTENGNLVKRPFALDLTKNTFLLGFKEEEWKFAFFSVTAAPQIF